ncbi:Na+/phosphate symporter [Lentisphaera araneosa HTCC2155]|uniref:Na+/phosphate symporter n=1 Tax=Lentisphaera araneosa HTCC2155 TaxID=313628 RepID=A6DTJ5_9BACT|nr:Na/Pi cotransporter family protein [Lentisphaera araneosa]EDM25034.1 Na+/phosphate symporter [Lentisphaera araneosa HTCC2155]
MINWVQIFIEMAGGLSLFLFGMTMMSQSLKSVAGDSLKNLLSKMTGNHFRSLISGTLITAITQSSSVTTVLLVGFVSAGLLNLSQSIGVIMGANIGSTFTAQIIAFNISQYSLLMIAGGFTLYSLAKNKSIQYYGQILLGLGLVFFGMAMMSSSTSPLRQYQPFIELMSQMDHALLGIIVGALFTALVQSSAATTGLLIILAGQNIITLEAGIAMALGSNVGTCITALLASIGKPRTAVHVAFIHIIFNVLGVILWFLFIPQLAELARHISPLHPELLDANRIAAETPRQLANAHTIFNFANALLFLPFCNQLAKLTEFLLPKKDSSQEITQHIHDMYLSDPVIALQQTQLEIIHQAQLITPALKQLPEAIIYADEESQTDITALRKQSSQVYLSLIDYSRKLGVRTQSSAQMDQVEKLLAVAGYYQQMIESLDEASQNLGGFVSSHHLKVSAETANKLHELCDTITHSVALSITALSNSDRKSAKTIIKQKPIIQELIDELTSHLHGRLLADAPSRTELYKLQTELVALLNRIYYFSKRIAKVIRHKYASEQSITDQDEEIESKDPEN